MPKNTSKKWKTVKTWTSFLTYNLDQFLINAQNLDQFLTLQHIYIVVELLIGPSLGVFKVINWSKFVSFKTLFVKKDHKNMGFSTFFKTRKIARVNVQSY